MKVNQRNRLEKYPGQMSENLLKGILILSPILSGICFAFGLWSLLLGEWISLWLVVLGTVALVYNWIDIQSAMAEYSFSSHGVTVKYPLEKIKTYPWDSFQQVCVCYYSRATEMHGYSMICLVKRGEKTDVFGRWKTANPFHYRNILCLDYSEELLETVKKNCPFEIPDLRGRGNYRL